VLGKGSLRLDCGTHRVLGTPESDEKGVTLSVNLDAAVSGERFAEHALMLRENLGIPVAQLLEELRRPLDVREQKGNRAAWKLRPRAHGPSRTTFTSAKPARAVV
jgi:hypothetical protein